MEALVVILAELLLAPAIAVAMVVLNLVGGVLLVMVELLAGLMGLKWSLLKRWRQKRNARKFGQQTQSTLDQPKTKLWSAVEITILSALLIVLVGALLVEFVFFTPTAHFVLRQINERTPYTVTAEHISGSLFDTSITARDVTVRTASGNPMKLDFHVDSFSADADVLSLILPGTEPSVDVAVSGMIGSVVTPQKNDDADETGNGEKRKSRRDFTMETLDLKNIAVNVTLGDKEPIAFKIDSLYSEPMRSDRALFDLFFRSNMQASIDGSPLTITMVRTENGRKTTWNADALPLVILSKLTQKAPLAWLSGGTVSLDVRDEWSRGERDDIDLDWLITLDNARFDVPSDISLVQRTLALPTASYVNSRTEPLELGFSLTLDPEGLRYASSLDALGLWDSVTQAISAEIAKRLETKSEAVEKRLDGLMDKTRRFLDRRSRQQGAPENEK